MHPVRERKPGDLLGAPAENILGQGRVRQDRRFFKAAERIGAPFFPRGAFFAPEKGEIAPMKKLLSLLIAFAALFALLSGCAPSDPAADVDFSALACTQVEENAYAVRFRISHYEDESSRAYSRIEIFDAEGEKNSDWLLLPEGVEGVSGMPQGMVALTVRERSALFVSSASAMSLFAAMDALDCVPLTTADTTWYIDEVKEAIAAGTLVEANRYDSPNYELIAAERAKSGMTLAVYSTMIDYKPEVESMLNSLGLYVLRDQSSAETHPLGRTEWCKVFGELTGRRAAADAPAPARRRIRPASSLASNGATMKYAAPELITSRSSAGLVKFERITNSGASFLPSNDFITPIPSRRGMKRSASTTSGCSDSILPSSVRPSRSVQTTVIPASSSAGTYSCIKSAPFSEIRTFIRFSIVTSPYVIYYVTNITTYWSELQYIDWIFLENNLFSLICRHTSSPAPLTIRQ